MSDFVEYKPMDVEHNVKAAVENLRKAYLSNDTKKVAKIFTDAESIIVSAICHDTYTVCKPDDERPKGEWIPCTKSGMPLTEQGRLSGEKWYGFKCSNPKCNYIYKGNALTESPFCQKCGADMQTKENSNG